MICSVEQILFVLGANCTKFLLGDDVNDSISADAISSNSRAPQLRKKSLSEPIFGWLLVAPAIVYIAIIVAWPLAETFRLSLTDARLGGENYVGLENYF